MLLFALKNLCATVFKLIIGFILFPEHIHNEIKLNINVKSVRNLPIPEELKVSRGF